MVTGTSLADENVIGIGVTDSVNWNGEVVTAMAVSEGVSMVVEKKMTSEMVELSCPWIDVCVNGPIVCSTVVDGIMLNEGMVEAGRLETSCRVLVENTSDIKVVSNVNEGSVDKAVGVRNAEASDVEASRPRVDVSLNKICDIENSVSATVVAIGTSCELVALTIEGSTDKEEEVTAVTKDDVVKGTVNGSGEVTKNVENVVGEGEKSKLVKDSSAMDVNDVLCEVDDKVKEGCRVAAVSSISGNTVEDSITDSSDAETNIVGIGVGVG